MKTRRPWTTAEIRQLRKRYPHERTADISASMGRATSAVYQVAQRLGLRKSDQFFASPASGRLDGVRGTSQRFSKGHVPWNKGTHWTAGGRSPETRYKAGNISGRAAQLVQPVGAYRVNGDGYLDRKVRSDGPPQRRWVAVHRLVWIEANGPVPDGYAVCFKPGRRTTELEQITPDALELVSRPDLMKRNTVHNLPKPIAELVQLRGALNRKINAREKAREEQNSRPA